MKKSQSWRLWDVWTLNFYQNTTSAWIRVYNCNLFGVLEITTNTYSAHVCRHDAYYMQYAYSVVSNYTDGTDNRTTGQDKRLEAKVDESLVTNAIVPNFQRSHDLVFLRTLVSSKQKVIKS